MWPSPIGPLGAVPDDGFLNLGNGAEWLRTETKPGERGKASLFFFLSFSLYLFLSVHVIVDDVPAKAL